MGATTIWERWDSMLPDGTINPGQMTSFNHYAFGAIGDWLHRVVAGLAPDAPGYERIRIAPHPLDGFDFASAEHLTPYGRARAAWTRNGGRIRVEATIPPNTTATVELPDGRTHEVGSGTARVGGGCRARGAAAGAGRTRLEPRGGDRRSRGVPARSSRCSRRGSPSPRTRSGRTRSGSRDVISARRSSSRPARSCSSAVADRLAELSAARAGKF